MDQETNYTIWIVVGVCIVVLVVIAAGALFLTSARVEMGGDGGDVDVGYALEPGAVTSTDGGRRATLRVRVHDGWTLEEFEPSGAELRSGTQSRDVPLAPLPSLPTESSFDLVFELPAAGEPGPDAPPERLRIQFRSKATSGPFGMTQASSSRSVSFVVTGDRLVD